MNTEAGGESRLASFMLLLLLTLVFFPTEKADLFEINRLYSDTCEPSLIQVIVWDWHEPSHKYRCQGWISLDNPTKYPRRTINGWRLLINNKEVEAKFLYKTYTYFDPEVADRELFPPENRRFYK